MRNRPDRIRHEGYNLSVLADDNETLQPVYRAQSVDISTDFSVETQNEIGNEGYVEIKDFTPTVTATVGANLVAKDIVSGSVNALQALALLSNADSVGAGRQEVISVGEVLKYHVSGALVYDSAATALDVHRNDGGIGGSDSSFFMPMGTENDNDFTAETGLRRAFAFIVTAPNEDRKMAVRHVAVRLKATNATANGTTFAQIYESSSQLPDTTNILAQSDPVNINSIGTSYEWVTFTFPKDTFLTKGTEYAIAIHIDRTYVAATNALNLADVTVDAGDGSFSTQATSEVTGFSATNTKEVPHSIGWEFDENDFDVYLNAVQVAGVAAVDDADDDEFPTDAAYDDAVLINESNVDMVVPIRGEVELQRVQYLSNMFATSLNLAFDVGGVATWEVGMEGDSQTQYTDDKKVVDALSVKVTSAQEGSNSIDVSSGSGATVEFQDIFQVTLNGETLTEVTAAADLLSIGSCEASKGFWFDNSQVIDFTTGLIKENDIVRIVGDPVTDPTWSTYRLVSSPGDQGAVYKGELDIRLITDTARPRVIEGFKVTRAAAASSTDKVVKIDAGTIYLKNSTNNELEMWRLKEDTYYSMVNTNDDIYLVARQEGHGLVFEEIIDASIDTLTDNQLVLALVTVDAGGDVTTVLDRRECHTHRLSLIQSAAYAADLSREVIMELGDDKDVDRSLTKPVPVTTDITAKDSDQEIYVLTHKFDHQTAKSTVAAATTNLFNADPTTIDTLTATFITDGVVAGDIAEVRGSKAIIKSVTSENDLVIFGWFGDIPPDGQAINVYKGIVTADFLEDDLGIQTNIYTSRNRLEADKNVVIETIDCRSTSESLSASVGGDGEVNISFTSDNLRMMIVA